MKVSLDPPDSAGVTVAPESAALAAWYDDNAAVRHLWAIKSAQGLRVIVRLEPTLDSDDTLPGWIANSRAWAHELQLRTHAPVQLEAIDELLIDGIDGDEGLVVAALGWRDPTVI
jgi:hypothetical protein